MNDNSIWKKQIYKKGCDIMAITSTATIFKTNDNEYGYTIEKCSPVPSGSKIKLFIPKVMGSQSKGKETFSANGLFANEQKPSCKNYVKKIDYIPVTMRDNQTWTDKLNNEGKIEKNTMFTVEFLNGNVSKPYATTK